MYCPKLGKAVLTSDSEVFLKKKWPSDPNPSVLMVQIANPNPLPCLELLKKIAKRFYIREKIR
jgi:hypothetical protein